MFSCCVKIYSQTASFRNPEFQNFHKSLDLPPPTTIIGLVGAALGKSPKMAQEYFDNHSLKIGIAGFSEGRTMDTWKYNKRNSNMHLYDPLLDGSVIKRELLFHPQFFLTFLSEEETCINELVAHFENPVFALTMGSSDSLAKVYSVERDLPITSSKKLKNCLVAGDIVEEVFRNTWQSLEFSIYNTSEPITYDLPTRFHYRSDYGSREIADTATFSFIGQEMELNFEIKGVHFQDTFIPIFDL